MRIYWTNYNERLYTKPSFNHHNPSFGEREKEGRSLSLRASEGHLLKVSQSRIGWIRVQRLEIVFRIQRRQASTDAMRNTTKVAFPPGLIGVFPLLFPYTSLIIIVFFEKPYRRPTIPVQVRLILWLQCAQQFRMGVTYIVVVNRYTIQTIVGQLIGIV